MQAKAYVQQTCTFLNGYGDHSVKTLNIGYARPRKPSYQYITVLGSGASKTLAFNIDDKIYAGPGKGVDIYKIGYMLPSKREDQAVATIYVWPESSQFFPGEVHLSNIEVLDRNGNHIAYYHATKPCVTIWKADTIW
ncbi:MAG: hypothetical protein ACOVP4_12420 [Bacteriovoracaceae bacterium]